VAGEAELSADQLQFLDETRLADARLAAHHDDCARLTLGNGRERASALGEFGAAADQGTALGRRLSQALEAKDGNRVVEALETMFSEGLVVGKARSRLPDRLRRQDFVGSSPVEEPGSEIGGLADHCIFAAPLAADSARDDVSHCERDMHCERDRGDPEFHGNEGLDLERGARCAQRIVAMGARRAEQRNCRIADMLVDRTAVALDDDVDHAEELLEQRPDLLWVKLRRQAGVADQVTKHNCDGSPVAIGLFGTIDGGFRLALQRTSTTTAEPIGRVVDVAAVAGARERRAAGRTKPAALPILRLAA
jgi:hypothetical protein